MTLRKCDQEKCGFLKFDGCPTCSECGASARMIEDDECVNCHNCLCDAGFIRKGESIGIVEEQVMVIKNE